MGLFPGLAAGEEPITRPNIERSVEPRSVSLQGRSYVSEGLVGTGIVPAETLDFLGDTLGSFSSLKIAPGSWKRVGAGYEAILWTLPDRGRNDPDAKLFFDYPARLHRFRVRFTPADGQVAVVPDGGLKLSDFRGRPFTGADPGNGTLTQRGIVLPAPASGVGSGKLSLDAESLQFTRDGNFYIGDEYTANVYYFDRRGRLRGIIQPRRDHAAARGAPPFRLAAITRDGTPQQSGRGRHVAIARWPHAVRDDAKRAHAGQRRRQCCRSHQHARARL